MLRGWEKRSVAVVMVIALVLVTGLNAGAEDEGWAQEPTAAAMIGDVVLVRPLGVAATAVGSVFFVVSLPFSVLGGNTKDVFDKLVVEPAKFTFKRPVGSMD